MRCGLGGSRWPLGCAESLPLAMLQDAKCSGYSRQRSARHGRVPDLADGDPLHPPQIWGTSGHLLLKTGWRSAQPQPVDLLPALQHHLFVGYHSTPSSITCSRTACAGRVQRAAAPTAAVLMALRCWPSLLYLNTTLVVFFPRLALAAAR
jgi:hypothetical protein